MQMDNYNPFIVGHANIVKIYIIFMHTGASKKRYVNWFLERWELDIYILKWFHLHPYVCNLKQLFQEILSLIYKAHHTLMTLILERSKE